MHIKKNDLVLVLSGNFKGKRGKVLKVFPQKKQAIVEGLNFIKRHTRPTSKTPQGGIIEKEAPMHVSKLMVVCPKCNQPTRVGHAIINDETREKKVRVRVCKKCQEMLYQTT